MLRWSEEQLREHRARLRDRSIAADRKAPDPAPEKKPSKYRNVKVEIDGQKFDSKSEAARFIELGRMQDAGLITDLRRQVSFELAPSVKIAGAARASPPLRYLADFVYLKDGNEVIEDVKGGPITEGFRIKRHLLAVLGHTIVEVRKKSTGKRIRR